MTDPDDHRWNEANMAWLRKRVDDGASAETIRLELGNGCTRNAVIGKAKRMGLQLHGGHPSTDVRPRPVRRERFKAASAKRPAWTARCITDQSEPVMELPPAVGSVRLLDLEPHHCRFACWRDGDQDQLFCGGQCVEGHSWCAPHCRIVYQPGSARWRI